MLCIQDENTSSIGGTEAASHDPLHPEEKRKQPNKGTVRPIRCTIDDCNGALQVQRIRGIPIGGHA